MAATDPAPLRRRFVTRRDVEDAHRSGQSISLAATDVITHEAAQRAADLGVAVQRPDRAAATRPTGGAPPPASDDRLRAAVRAAVVAELGTEPPGLDAAIDRVLSRRQP